MKKDEILRLAQISKLEFTKEEIKILEKEFSVSNYSDLEIIDAAITASNLARFDGIRFFPSEKGCASIEELYIKTRSRHFDFETKKQILLGTFATLKENCGKFFTEPKTNPISIDDLRDDVVQKSLTQAEVFKNAPNHNGEYFVVHQVVEE